MKTAGTQKIAPMVGIGFSFGVVGACGGGEGGGEGPLIPPALLAEHADSKHTPAGLGGRIRRSWEEGMSPVHRRKNPDVYCASCHGKDGKPVKAGDAISASVTA